MNAKDLINLSSRFGISKKKMQRRLKRFDKITSNIEISNKEILEIGAGDGIFSCLLSLNGAKKVIGLEPETSGSDNNVIDRFNKNIASLNLQNVSVINSTFQEFNSHNDKFDLIVSIASVILLDEAKCEKLMTDSEARSVYINLFKKVKNMLKPKGIFLLTDCGRKNLFFTPPCEKIGIRNPLAKTIEWHKHQQPSFWSELLGQAGFSDMVWRWIFPMKLPLRMDTLFDNYVMSYFTVSYFVLEAK